MRWVKHQCGFSLVELLVVISIIGVLSIIGLVSYQGTISKTKIVQKKADLDALAKVFETKYNFATGLYPDSSAVIDADFTSGKKPDGAIIVDPDKKSFTICINLQDYSLSSSCTTTNSDCYCRSSAFGALSTPIAQAAPDTNSLMLAPAAPGIPTPTPSALPSAAPSTLTIKINGPNDDAYQLYNGSNQFTDKIYMGSGYIAGLRFNGITIPQGSIINSAILSVSPFYYYGSSTTVTIYGQAADNAADFSAEPVSSRPKTSSSSSWNITGQWSQGKYYSSPNFSSVIQEIINRVNWASGNSLALILGTPTNKYRSFSSYETSPAIAAQLTISYSANTPAATPTALPALTPVITAKPSCINSNYSGDGVIISWANSTNPVTYIDLSTDSAFASFYNKGVSGTTSTKAPVGFTLGRSGGLQLPGTISLSPETNYYVRLFNTARTHSTVQSFSIPACPTDTVTTPTTPPSTETNSPLAGIYVYYDWANLNPSSYPWIKGGDVIKRWNEIETSEGQYNWGSLDQWINDEVAIGKTVILKVTANDNTADGVPQYVYNAGAPKVAIGTVYYPKWWDNTFKDKYKKFIQKLGDKYRADPKVGGVLVSVGEYGEAEPGYGSVGSSGWEKAWSDYGLTRDIWVAYAKEIIDAYVSAFTLAGGQFGKPLFLQEQSWPSGSTAQTLAIVDYAASKGVNMGYNGLSNDNAYNARWFTPFNQYVKPGTLMGRLEAHAAELNTQQTYWAVLNGLRNHATILSFYGKGGNGTPRVIDNTDNKTTFEFANKYLGKTINNTPGAWIAFMRTVSGLDSPQSWGGERFNYNFWLEQINPDTTTVSLYDVNTDKEGAYAKRTDIASGKNAFYLNVDDGYIYPGSSARFNSTNGKQITINVKYFDNNSSPFDIKYDSTSGIKTVTVQKTNSKAWRTYSVTISDAYFGNRLTNGADLLITASGSDTTLHMVEIEGGEVAGISTILKQINLQRILQNIISFFN